MGTRLEENTVAVVAAPQPEADNAPVPHAAAAAAQPVPAVAPPSAGVRLASIDAYRGLVMLLMASEGLGISDVAGRFKASAMWQFVAGQVDHVPWVGCSLWDIIQPSFMFLVGVALPFSLAARRARGDTSGRMFGHAVYRALLLVALGIFLRSDGHRQTYFTFEDVLTQIGLGYVVLFLLARTPTRTQVAAALGILAAYWLAFALYPLPGPGFDYARVGVPADWPHLHGFAAHWDKNTNLAAAFDQWFLNLFPRAKPFVYNGGGYLTLNFVPSLATMIFGLLAGNVLRDSRPDREKVRVLLTWGAVALGAGLLLSLAGICPIVKRIWTPSWTLFSTGITCALLAAFYAALDARSTQSAAAGGPAAGRAAPWWAFPLVVVGMNSIAMYVIAHLFRDFIERSLKTNLGQNAFEVVGGAYAPIVESGAVLFVMWLICWWMYRRRLFLKI